MRRRRISDIARAVYAPTTGSAGWRMSYGAPGRHGKNHVAAGGRRSPRSAQADRHGGIMTNPIMPPSPARLTEDGRCPHQPPCPGALEPDRLAARLVARYPDQGWSLLCNGVVLLDDGDQLLPDGRIVSPPPPRPGAAVVRENSGVNGERAKAGEHHRPAHHNRRPPTSRMHRAPGSGRVRAARYGGRGAEHIGGSGAPPARGAGGRCPACWSRGRLCGSCGARRVWG